MRWGTGACLVALLCLAGSAQAAVLIEIGPDGRSSASGPVRLLSEDPGLQYLWRITVGDEAEPVEVRVAGGINVSWPRQIVPEVDDRFPAEVREQNIAGNPALVFNATGADGTFRILLSVPGPGDHDLRLTRDVAPPDFSVGPIQNLTHRSFTVTTTTTEYAFGKLQVAKASGEDPILYPTTIPALRQTFPAIGLQPDTEYQYQFVFTDWAGNEVTTGAAILRTLPKPDAPIPIIQPVAPRDGDKVAGDGVNIIFSIDPRGADIAAGGVRLYFDKVEVPQHELRITGNTVTYEPPGRLEGRTYSVSVEVTNVEGGVGEARWTFDVEGGSEAPIDTPALGVIALAGTVVLVAAVRRWS